MFVKRDIFLTFITVILLSSCGTTSYERLTAEDFAERALERSDEI